ncbi:MAG: motility protein A [Eubacteriales bacterium]
MDLLTLFGFLLAVILLLFGIMFNTDLMAVIPSNIKSFMNYGSLAITVGGTFASLMMSYSPRMFAQIPSHLRIALFPTKYDTLAYIDQIVEFAKEARMKGLLSLEEKLSQTRDEFLRSSLLLVVDSVEPEKVKQLLEAELDYMEDRHAQAREFYEKGAQFAPAYGMIGTLIGLVLMLKDMQDASVIGPAMAVALITTFYGSVLANVFFIPIANKLKLRHEEEILCKMLICEGVLAIQAGENPKFIDEKLTMLLPLKVRIKKQRLEERRQSQTEGTVRV